MGLGLVLVLVVDKRFKLALVVRWGEVRGLLGEVESLVKVS